MMFRGNCKSQCIAMFIIASTVIVCLVSIPLATAAHAQSEQAEMVGVARCASCHERPSQLQIGQSIDDFVHLNESTIWYTEDKHAQAYELLKTPLGSEMGKRLGIDVLRDRRCLSCHAGWSHESSEPPKDVIFGVACESCHGPGSIYRGLHDQESWRTRSPAEKRALGMIDVRDPITKAEQCLACHLGDPQTDKFVTHRMYAAGHPPLPAFELVAFARQMPRHWRSLHAKPDFQHRQQFAELAGYQREDILQSKEVLLSNLSALQKQIELLTYQLSQSQVDASLPDLAAYDCYGCHHDLVSSDQSYRQARGYGGFAPGRPMRPRWADQLAIIAARIANDDTELKNALRELDAAIAAQPFGDTQRVSTQATIVIDQIRALQAILRVKPLTHGDLRSIVSQFDAALAAEAMDYGTARMLVWAGQSFAQDLATAVHPTSLKHEDVSDWNDNREGKLKQVKTRLADRGLTAQLQLALPAGRETKVADSLGDILRARAHYQPDEFASSMRSLMSQLEAE